MTDLSPSLDDSLDRDGSSSQNGGRRVTSLIGRSIFVAGRRTGMRLEPEMWAALHEISVIEETTLEAIFTEVDQQKNGCGSLSSAVRVFVMRYFKEAATAEGHRRAGHGPVCASGHRRSYDREVRQLAGR